MEKTLNVVIQSEDGEILGNKTGPQNQKNDHQNSQDSCNSLRKTYIPDSLKVPNKEIKNPERYRSPTDSMMSPVTKDLLARNRKAGGLLLPSSLNQNKIHELRIQDVGFLLRNEELMMMVDESKN